MLHYRLYLMNRFSGHIDAVRDIAAPEDLTAIGCAAEFAGRRAVELWYGSRKVHRFEASAAGVDAGAPPFLHASVGAMA